jgi:hypothetical protein
MTRTTCRSILLPVTALLLCAATPAAAESFALGVKAGTTGLGLEGTWRLTDAVNLRGGYYAFDYGTELEETGVEYDGDLRLRNAALFADWHVFRGSFRLSAGAINTGNEFVGSADGQLELGQNVYVAEVDAKVGWSTLAPYLGIGFGNAVQGGRWSFSFDLGVMYTGSPSVRLDGTVSDPALQAQFEEDLERERADLAEELSDAKYYPVVGIGFAYRF